MDTIKLTYPNGAYLTGGFLRSSFRDLGIIGFMRTGLEMGPGFFF